MIDPSDEDLPGDDLDDTDPPDDADDASEAEPQPDDERDDDELDDDEQAGEELEDEELDDDAQSAEVGGAAQFDPAHPGSNLVGTPAHDRDYWHPQQAPNSCALAAQEFILDDVSGRDFTEQGLRAQALEHGWYTPGGGTPQECLGYLLELNGVPVQRQSGATLDDIGAHLERGEKVLVALDSDVIWYGQHGAHAALPLGATHGMPGQHANHAVQVIGIDRSDPAHPQLILNDPGHPAGRGMLVPAERFAAAWADSGNFLVATATQSRGLGGLYDVAKIFVTSDLGKIILKR